MKSQCCWQVLALVALVGCGAKENSTSDPAQSNAAVPQQEGTSTASDWPFKEPESVAVITLARVVDGSQPILIVVHDEDGDWQFLDGGKVTEQDAATVSLKRVVDLEPAIKDLADLPLGWTAERAATDQPWKRFQR